MLEGYRVILGSQSPRRKELLAGLDIEFETLVLTGEEVFPEGLAGEEIPLFLARQKADAYNRMMDGRTLVITADTIVWLDGRMYGKPHTEEEAREMLRSLSSRTHQEITGVCVRSAGREETFAAPTRVTFARLTEEEIEYYVRKYRPMDKAGSYGVQEWIGYIGVERIEGSYYNVMGLPVQRLYGVLKRW